MTDSLAYWFLRVLRGVGRTPESHSLSPDLQEGAQNEIEWAGGRWRTYFDHFQFNPTTFAGARILDIGCGYGGAILAWAQTYPTASWVGIEPYSKMVQIAERGRQRLGLSNVRFCCAPGERLPFPDHSFDLICTNHTIEHVLDPRAVVAETVRCLRPGGLSLHVFPPYYNPLAHHLTWIAFAPGVHYLFGPETLTSAVNRLIAEGRLQHAPLSARMTTPWGRPALPTLNGCTIRDWKQLCGRLDGHVSHTFVPFGADLLDTRRAKGSAVLRGALSALAAVTRLGHRVWPDSDVWVGEIQTVIHIPTV